MWTVQSAIVDQTHPEQGIGMLGLQKNSPPAQDRNVQEPAMMLQTFELKYFQLYLLKF